MKITCQSCQSKYTIADEKIQGKVAKIRCRKCGATVLVDGTSAESPGAPNADLSADSAVAAAGTWLVNLAEGDQRSMSLQELVDAYNSGVAVADTYLWKDGMADWAPLSDCPEIVDALHAASGGNPDATAEAIAAEASDSGAALAPQASASLGSRPSRGPAKDAIAAAFAPTSIHDLPTMVGSREELAEQLRAEEPIRRGRTADLFASRAADDEIATSAPPAGLFGLDARASSAAGSAPSDFGALDVMGRPTGARDEQSVLFSLAALTSTTQPGPGAIPSSQVRSASSEDSGLIDLNALAKTQASLAPSLAAQAPSPAVIAQPAPFSFPSALGAVEAPRMSHPAEKRSSSMGLIAIGAVVAVAAVVAAVFLTRRPDELPGTLGAASGSAEAPALSAVPPATSANLHTSDPLEAAASPSAGGAGAATKKQPPSQGAVRPHHPAAEPPGASPTPASPTPAPAPKKSGGCGCPPGDLQCQIRCSATGQ